MRSSKQAQAYVTKLRTILRYLGTCDGNMEQGSLRADINVSVRRPGGAFGTRCEIKNLNSFRFLERAIEYEVRRQIEVIEDGGTVRQETRLYDPDRDETRPMRSKEDAHDYRYFPDPDLLPLEITEPQLAEVQAALPELPHIRRERYASEYSLTAYDASVLTSSREIADYFDAAAAGAPAAAAKLVANWIAGPLSAKLNDAGLEIGEAKVGAKQLRKLVERIADGTISNKIAREVFDAIWEGEASGDDAADAIIDKRGLRQISDSGELEKIADEVLAKNAQQVADYRGGKEKAFNSLVGQVMKATKGKANPQQVTDILKRKLA
jgi:aspartyl-tRNA(Asn)/glutamyl-tRNA(Gln) amidotransferase subunit B